MPHILIKMLKGRSDELKTQAVEKVSIALCEALGCTLEHVSVAIEDYTPQEWQTVFSDEIADNEYVLKKPEYNPKDLLK